MNYYGALPFGGRMGQAVAFTMVELLVSITIILVLMSGLGFASMTVIEKSRLHGVQQLIMSIHASIDSTSGRTLSGTDGRVYRMWDMNADNVVDGDPALDPGFNAALRSICSSINYGGYLNASKVSLPSKYIDNATKRPKDAWGLPVQIAFATGVYGSSWFGIWSCGPDKVSGTADDIVSWKQQ